MILHLQQQLKTRSHGPEMYESDNYWPCAHYQEQEKDKYSNCDTYHSTYSKFAVTFWLDFGPVEERVLTANTDPGCEDREASIRLTDNLSSERSC